MFNFDFHDSTVTVSGGNNTGIVSVIHISAYPSNIGKNPGLEAEATSRDWENGR